MKRKYVFSFPHWLSFVVLCLSTLYSCQEAVIKTKPKIATDQFKFTDAEMKRFVLLDTNYFYPIEAIKTMALDHASRMLDDDGVVRTISRISTVPSLFTNTGRTSIKTSFDISKPATPSLYIVNFKDRKGFIVLSADKRAPGILATVGSGSLDSAAHIGLKIFIENAVKHVDEIVGQLEAMRGDSIFERMVAKEQALIALQQNAPVNNSEGRTEVGCNVVLKVPGVATPATSCGGGTCTIYVTTTPISTTYITKYISYPLLTTQWDQGPPYNLGQPDNSCVSTGQCGSNSLYLAGCVPVAEGQVVAYFHAKENLGDWAAITSQNVGCNFTPSQSSEVSGLLHSIYLSYGIFVSRTCSSTGAGFDIGDLSVTDPRGITC